MSETSDPTKDALKQLQDYNQQTHAHPCPSCGHCPTCGRGGYGVQPYYPPRYPYITGPWYGEQITWTSGTIQAGGRQG